ncbi:hypothetical protein MPH_03656 [Macrophomina phaseolina MS6]|uniref:N-acetyltransferase domain-containing protein n=1 Tax=Macrophomina phaseolina (strain MS6) TaxID=1126212 RepID=K2SR16_MACPH|nr:hypothetical protein MPH_03656 [Macrophomina phaseolina MS6]
MRSFYLDPHWASLWRGISLDKIIRDCAKRLPWNLVKASMGKRHQKVVDDESQKIVGYARWILPEEQDDEWADALVKELDPERRRMYEQQFQDVTEEGKIRGLNSDMVEELSEAIEQAESQVRSTCGRLLSEYNEIFISMVPKLTVSRSLGLSGHAPRTAETWHWIHAPLKRTGIR